MFLNRDLGQTPEENLLLPVQGMIAEYERAQILERSRRGKVQAARNGAVSVPSGAPFGYRYITKQEGQGEARYQVVLDEARVVQTIFTWIGQERCSIREVCRRFNQAGVRTRTGKARWESATIGALVRDPAYQGTAGYGTTRVAELRPRLRVNRRGTAAPRRPDSVGRTAPGERPGIAVPALVSEELFAAVQDQLEENRRRHRLAAGGARYLLQG